MGQEGAPIGEVFLRDCKVSEEAIVGGVPGQGFRTVMKALNKQRINLSALSTGPAIRLLDEGIRHARKRKQGASPSATISWFRPCWRSARWRLKAPGR